MTKKSFGEIVSDNIAMLPFHLTGLTAVIKGIEVVGDIAAGKKPKTSDVIGAAGLIDVDGAEGVDGCDIDVDEGK